MGGSPSQPPAPDYQGAADTQGQQNLALATTQTIANRPNVTTPWGTQTWTSSNDTQAYQDAMNAWYQGGQHGPPPSQSDYQNWNENISLTPEEQAAEAAQQKVQAGTSDLGLTLEGQAANKMAGGFNAPSLSSYMDAVSPLTENYSGFNPNAAGVNPVNTSAPQFNSNSINAGINAAYGQEMGLLEPQMQEASQTEQNNLALEGLTPGSEAYNNAMRDLNNSQTAERTQAANQAVQTGMNEADTNYQEALAGYGAGNQAQQQNYNEALGTYGTGQSALSAEQQLQSQEYGQAIGSYQTAYQSALNNYTEPLNAMQAVLGGEQVQNPSFTPGTPQQGASAGNYQQAAQQQAAWEQGLYNSDVASNNANNATYAGVGTAVATAAIIA